MVIGLIFSGIVITIPNNVNAEWTGLSYYWDDGGGSDNKASTASNWYEMNGEIKTNDVVPTENEWTNDRVVDIALLVIIMGIITLFNYLGYVKGLFLLQILSFMMFLFVLVPLWPGNEMGGLLVLVFGIGNIGLLIGGLKK